MRPGQNKRMRGRNNSGGGGGRKGPNPLTRSYESNGPDVKIRGTAQHVGEKYLQLARDAQTSGDPVAAESYLQHAEHYFRLIAAAQQAQYQAQTGYVRQAGDTDGDDDGDDDDLSVPDRFASPAERVPPPQPFTPPPPNYADRSNGHGGERPQGHGLGERSSSVGDRQDRSDGQDRPYRHDRGNADRDQRHYQDRQGQPHGERQGQPQAERNDRTGPDRDRGYQDRQGQPNSDRQDRNFDRGGRNDRQDRNRNRFGGGQDNREQRDMQFRDQPRIAPVSRDPVPEPRLPPAAPAAEIGTDLPAFITAPVRTVTPSVEPQAGLAPSTALPDAASVSADDPMTLRPRRRRRTRMVSASDVDGQSEFPDNSPPEG